jgi:aminoglycoside 6'-N-acetyltransferase I
VVTHTVVPLDAARLAAAAALFVDVFNAPPWNDRWSVESAGRRLRDLVDTPGYAGAALVDAQDVMLGFVGGYRQRWYDGWHFYLAEMAVTRSRQRSGLGTQLLGGFLDALDDVSGTYLLTQAGGPAATFYEKHGFRPAGRQAVMTRF